MPYALRLELIADDYYWAMPRSHRELTLKEELYLFRRLGPDKSRSSVARITGVKDGQLTETYLQGKRDYSGANATGSRGIMALFVLSDGLYEIVDRYKLNKVNRYFARVSGWNLEKINREEVIECLKSASV